MTVIHWNSFMSNSAFWLGLVQLFFIVNFFWSMFAGRKCGRNPWHGTTLEWDAPSPPPHGNFDHALTSTAARTSTASRAPTRITRRRPSRR